MLVATDVAARGLDIADLPVVFNFDVPFNAEDYVHRIGRTGRAGASGLAVTLVTRDDARLVADIEKLIKTKLEIEAIEIDDDRPQRPRRREQDEGARSAEAAPARTYEVPRRVAPTTARDPFFDSPYETERERGCAGLGCPRQVRRGCGARPRLVAEHQAEEEGGFAARRRPLTVKRPAARTLPASGLAAAAAHHASVPRCRCGSTRQAVSGRN